MNNKVAGAGNRAAAAAGFLRQTCRDGLLYPRRPMKSLPARIQNLTVCLCWALAFMLVSTASAQTNYYAANGTEYAVIGSLPGDQVFPDAAISPTGGFVVWQDNITDGDGWGISAMRLTPNLSADPTWYHRVNIQGANDQENPRVAMLKNGGAAFVWQGGQSGFEHIYTRFLTPTNTFLTTNDILVNDFTNHFQVHPAIAVLNNSNVVVVWASYNQYSSNSMWDVYGQVFDSTGVKIGGNFLVNQFTTYNQRSPAVTALAGGGFVVAWVSEQERVVSPDLGANTTAGSASSIITPTVDIYARIYNGNAVAQTDELLVNTDNNPCSQPALAAGADGGFLLAWAGRSTSNVTNSWDVYARLFSSSGVGGTVTCVNTRLYGDQYSPRVAAIGLDYLVVWTSMGQDGSREGVYGQFVHNDGSKVGTEFLVNTTTISQQKQPAVASDGVGRFLALWTSFTGSPYNFDLYAQRYANVSAVLPAVSAPYVWAPFVTSNNVYQPRLAVSWTPLQGLSISNYEVYVDGSTTPMATVVTNQWTMTAANGLATNSTHSFQVDYVVTDGRRSPISDSASGTTWGGKNWGGIPYEWMAAYFGGYVNGVYRTNYWMLPTTVLTAGGPTLYSVFLSGGDPFDSTTWLQTQLNNTQQGLFLNWNTQAGATYQVQVTADFKSWTNVGNPRFAAGTTDSYRVGGSSAGYYRVVLLR